MYRSGPAPTDQRARVRPISFLLTGPTSFGTPVYLAVRPEDMTRNEPSRVAVHQTLGKGTSGWADDFGEGLPSVQISGHTGWRYNSGVGEDGFQSFESLNRLLVHDLPAARQRTIDTGLDPALVKLLYIDLLDNFTWSVAVTQFALRRSKSRPLLFQYNINLQAVDTAVDRPLIDFPLLGSQVVGLKALGGVTSFLGGIVSSIKGLISSALGTVNGFISTVASSIQSFVSLSNEVFAAVNDVVRSSTNFVSSVANNLIWIARSLATVGANIFRTFNNIVNLPATIKASLSRVAGAFNEALCILSNSLRPRKTYQDYTGVYGASNCSSTTGGRQDSAYANMNAFSLIRPETDVATSNSAALASISTLSRMDPVLAPMPVSEMGRHVTNIVTGLAL